MFFQSRSDPLWIIRKPRDRNNNLAPRGFPLTRNAQSIPNFAHRRWILGACHIAGFVGTSTGRGTRRRGKPERSGDQGEPVRLSDPASGRGLRTRTDDAAGPRLPNDQRLRPEGLHGEPGRDRWTAHGESRAERQRPGAVRIQPTADGVRPAGAQAEVQALNGQVQPGLGEGTQATVRPGWRPLAQFRRRIPAPADGPSPADPAMIDAPGFGAGLDWAMVAPHARSRSCRHAVSAALAPPPRTARNCARREARASICTGTDSNFSSRTTLPPAPEGGSASLPRQPALNQDG